MSYTDNLSAKELALLNQRLAEKRDPAILETRLAKKPELRQSTIGRIEETFELIKQDEASAKQAASMVTNIVLSELNRANGYRNHDIDSLSRIELRNESGENRSATSHRDSGIRISDSTRDKISSLAEQVASGAITSSIAASGVAEQVKADIAQLPQAEWIR